LKIYSFWGYAIIAGYFLSCAVFAPPHLGLWASLGIAGVYFVVCWFVTGTYLANVLHLGIAHRSLDFQVWFAQTVTLVNNAFFVYVAPIAWVNRHRLHHMHTDRDGDPNKIASDGFWRTLWLCMFPYPCQRNVAHDDILKTWPFRLAESTTFLVLSQVFNFGLLWWIVRDLAFAAVIWFAFRVFALWINMVQNFWTHDRRFGYRSYDDPDNAMNIGEFLPVTATFSACLQNNHHHYPSMLRLSHSDSEYDFGFATVKAMKALGLVKSSRTGDRIGPEIPLQELGF
jgi:stearoyl-CoA desaturase (delta-9 desaturase)